MRFHFIILALICFFYCLPLPAQERMGQVISVNPPGLPTSYNFQEYVFPEPDDKGICTGNMNANHKVEKVFFAQTHRLSIDHPLFFTISDRPSLFQVALTGSGSAPDVAIEGFLDGTSLGKKCLKGPQNLQSTFDTSTPDFDRYFSVTIPKSWMKNGLEIKLTTGNKNQIIATEDLNMGIRTELNMVIFDMDFLDYNFDPHKTPIIDNFIQEIASSIPASVIRIGKFPVTLKYPEIASASGGPDIIRLQSKSQIFSNGVPFGNINALANSSLFNLHRTSEDFLAMVYFGNTLNLDPGGWGGGHSFVSFDYNDVTIHELGHALSLPHWGDNIKPPSNDFQYHYPYTGEQGAGDGRGSSWNFIQDTYEFIDPICRTNPDRNGKERSDAMQRNSTCLEQRINGTGPWDGFGDFSAHAMHRYLIGGLAETGKVLYRGNEVDYQFNIQNGFPQLHMEGGKRAFRRHPSQQTDYLYVDEYAPMPGDEKLDQDVYLVYGSAHESQELANIVYKPLKFNGTLPPILDPTDPATIASIKTDPIFRDRLGPPRDITLKLTYADGSIMHAINPYHSYGRNVTNDFGPFRYDLCMWSLIVPGDKELVRVQLYKRPLVIRDPSDPIPGNIVNPSLNITADNFMDEAVFQAEYYDGQPKVPAPNSFGNRVWNDLNRNGKDDNNEPGIEGVTILLWGDSNGDDIPDSQRFMGSTKTDENGHYIFRGLEPGKYLAFVWFLENWEEGDPLHNMLPVPQVAEPDSDIDFDNNGRRGADLYPGLGLNDIASGIIELTKTGEPLGDGNQIDDYFDFDVSGNNTIDFGFYQEGTTSTDESPNHPFKLYPNPVIDFLNVEHYSGDNIIIELWNVQGKRVLSRRLKKSESVIDLKTFPTGLYLARFKNNRQEILHTEKLIINQH